VKQNHEKTKTSMDGDENNHVFEKDNYHHITRRFPLNVENSYSVRKASGIRVFFSLAKRRALARRHCLFPEEDVSRDRKDTMMRNWRARSLHKGGAGRAECEGLATQK
jgi:hypothetical protein